MRQAAFLLALTILIPRVLEAQQPRNLDIPRYEVGLQLDLNYFDQAGDLGGGGGRFHYNFDNHFALDTQLTHRIQGEFGQTNFFCGVRAGQHFHDYGLFFRARPGLIHFGTAHGASYLTRNTIPAFDVGATIENYNGPILLRLDLGATIVGFGSATVAPPPPPAILLGPAPTRLGTRTSPAIGLGVAFRF